MTTNRMVVGIDGSEPSRDAMRWAIAEAASRGADLDIIHTWVPWESGTLVPAISAGDPHDAEMQAKELLEDETERALAGAKARPTNVRSQLAFGDALSVLLLEAEHAELVVGANGKGAITRAIAGSVVDGLVTQSVSTVTVVPHLEQEGDGRIVVGVDGSDDSVAALRWAFDLARRREASLFVVDVVPSPMEFSGPTGRAYAKGNRRLELHEMLAALDTGATSPAEMTVLTPFGHPGRVLVAEATGASQLVVGAHGHGVLSGLLSDTAQRCVHHAPCATTVVKAAR